MLKFSFRVKVVYELILFNIDKYLISIVMSVIIMCIVYLIGIEYCLIKDILN